MKNIYSGESFGEIKKNLQKAKILVNPLFNNWNILHKTPYLSVTSRIAIEPVQKFVYIRIPKAANSTVTKLIWSCLYSGKYYSETNNLRYKDAFKIAKQVSLKQARLAKKYYYFFVIVRNPYDRILSAYLNKFSTEKYIKKFGKQIAECGDGYMNFKSFCHFLRRKGLYKNPHWLPQSEYIWPSYERLDYIGKVENLESDLKNIFSKIFEDCHVDTSNYFGPTPTQANSKRHIYYDREVKDIINRLYLNDFHMFDYDIE